MSREVSDAGICSRRIICVGSTDLKRCVGCPPPCALFRRDGAANRLSVEAVKQEGITMTDEKGGESDPSRLLLESNARP
jgi:hypothetical protein